MFKMFSLHSGDIAANAFAPTEQDAVKFLLMVASKEGFSLFEAISVLEAGKSADDIKLFLTPLEALRYNLCTNADFMRYRKDIGLALTDDIYSALKLNAKFWKDPHKEKRKIAWYAYVKGDKVKMEDDDDEPTVYGE